jgi:hypothetical protein
MTGFNLPYLFFNYIFWESVEVIEYPTTPPAGPERIAFDPVNLSIGASPPSLCIKNTLLLRSKSSSKPF